MTSRQTQADIRAPFPASQLRTLVHLRAATPTAHRTNSFRAAPCLRSGSFDGGSPQADQRFPPVAYCYPSKELNRLVSAILAGYRCKVFPRDNHPLPRLYRRAYRRLPDIASQCRAALLAHLALRAGPRTLRPRPGKTDMHIPSRTGVARAVIVTAATAFCTTLCLLAVCGPVYERSAQAASLAPWTRPSGLA